jgi:hypothetical protein
MHPTCQAVAATATLLVLASGCGGGDPTPATAPATSGPTTTAPDDGAPALPPLTPCPVPTTTAVPFPSGEPADLPRPGFAADPHVLDSQAPGVEVLTFTTAQSLRDAVLYVTQAYPAAGWVLGEGDSEQDEADIPFARGPVHGKLRLSGDDACSTTWTVATVSGTATGLDAVPGADASDGG